MEMEFFQHLKFWKQSFFRAQLTGRLFSPSDIWKKLSQPLLLHFPFGMGTYVHHTILVGVYESSKGQVFLKGPRFE